MSAAVGAEEESDDEEKGKGDQPADDDSDASSAFGLDTDTKASASNKKKESKGKTPKSPKGEKAGAPEKATAKAEGKALEKANGLLEQATKLMGALAPVTCAAIWKGAFKDADISSKLKKLTQAGGTLSQQASTIETQETKNEMEGMASRIEKRVGEVSLIQDVLGQFRNVKQNQMVPLLKDTDLRDKLVNVCGLMDAETLSSFLLHLAAKTSEAGSPQV